MKRTMTVDQAVRWAYREELPKCWQFPDMGPAGYGNGSRGANAAAEWWTLPDNVFGVVPDLGAVDGPSADAVRIHQAVSALEGVVVQGEVDAAAVRAWAEVDLAGLDGVCAGAVAVALQKLSVPRLVRGVAVLGLPDAQVDAPEVRYMSHPNGKVRWYRREVVVVDGARMEIEVDGYDRKAHRPYADAYRKPYLDPDPVPSLVERAKAEVWRAAMDVLYEDLAGGLDEVDLRPCALPPCPWAMPAPTVLPDLRAAGRAARAGRAAG